MSDSRQAAKATIRRQAFARRVALPGKDERSRQAVSRLLALPEYETAATVLWYVDARSEMRTQQALPSVLRSNKTVVVPWCAAEGELRLFRLTSMDELALGAYSILEPSAELKAAPDRSVAPKTLDLVIVPGVAFDLRGGRVGHGLGYYDRLLTQLRPEAAKIGLCFDCQLFETVPTSEHDIAVDRLVTETTVIDSKAV